MKSLAAVVLLVLVSTGCIGKAGSGGARGPVIQRTDSAQQDHGDFSRPLGQR